VSCHVVLCRHCFSVIHSYTRFHAYLLVKQSRAPSRLPVHSTDGIRCLPVSIGSSSSTHVSLRPHVYVAKPPSQPVSQSRTDCYSYCTPHRTMVISYTPCLYIDSLPLIIAHRMRTTPPHDSARSSQPVLLAPCTCWSRAQGKERGSTSVWKRECDMRPCVSVSRCRLHRLFRLIASHPARSISIGVHTSRHFLSFQVIDRRSVHYS